MRTGTKILFFSIILPALAFFLIYIIAKTSNCVPNCKNKICGDTDGCSSNCKDCPTGGTCNGKKCMAQCTPNCVDKKYGDTDGCSSTCTSCPDGSTCDGKKCQIKTGTAGICYFDIDGTLTTATCDTDNLVKQCLDNNFAVGIITASNRTIEDICGNSRPSWMPDLLCKQFTNDPGLFNSTTFVAGSKTLPTDYPKGENPGYIKGFDMEYGKKTFYPTVPDKCVVLFDDDTSYINGVKDYNTRNKTNFDTQCANTGCGLGNPLDENTVKNKVLEMKANGCV